MKIFNFQHSWRFYDWWFPEKVLNPRSFQELLSQVRQAIIEGKKIRPAGSFHNFNDAIKTDDIQLRTDYLNKVLEVDKDRLLVKVEAGIKLKALGNTLATQHLALPNCSFINTQSIAGVVSTAAHGSGYTGTMSSFVEEIELIDGKGELRHLTKESHPHLFDAAVVSLGYLGVIYSLTLKVVPLKRLKMVMEVCDVGDRFSKIPEYLEKYKYFQVIKDLYSDKALFFKFVETDENIKYNWITKIKTAFIGFSTHLLYFISPLRILSFKRAFRLCAPLYATKRTVDAVHKAISPNFCPPFADCEVSVSLEKLQEAIELIEKIFTRYKKKALVIYVLLRFVQKDSHGYLSQSYQKGPIVAFHFPLCHGKQSLKFIDEIENAFIEIGGSVHLGKRLSMTKEKMEKVFGSRLQKFKDAKNELDPGNVFSNPWLDSLFSYTHLN